MTVNEWSQQMRRAFVDAVGAEPRHLYLSFDVRDQAMDEARAALHGQPQDLDGEPRLPGLVVCALRSLPPGTMFYSLEPMPEVGTWRKSGRFPDER